jgi:hypothetical protein
MIVSVRKILSIFDRLKNGESLDSIIDEEILDAKKYLDHSFVRSGHEDPEIISYIDGLQKIRYKYE